MRSIAQASGFGWSPCRVKKVMTLNCWSLVHITNFDKLYKGVEMKLPIFGILLCILISGCVSPQIIPKANVLSSIRTINVVPIESYPLILHPEGEEDKKAIEAASTSLIAGSVRSTNGPAASLSGSVTPLASVPIKNIRTGASLLAIVGGTAMLAEAASAGKEVPGETAVIEMGQPNEIWTPSVEYAKTAAQALRQDGVRVASAIEGYVKLPITDRSMTWHMEQWLGPIRRLYSSDMSAVDYTAIGCHHADAILEVGILNYEYYSGRLILQVFVRLINPCTKQVLGRARQFSSLKAGPLAPLLRNEADGMKLLILETGNQLLARCMTEIGLTFE
jgi:hypothetical protein